MKLDPRIKSLSDVLTCFDIEKAKAKAIILFGHPR